VRFSWNGSGSCAQPIRIFQLLSLEIMNSMLGGPPCHHSMARPRLADGRDGLQQWRVAANILNKQPRTNDKGWFSSLGVRRGCNYFSP
jgi:hypothetical protein